jgi:hypothetical protein
VEAVRICFAESFESLAEGLEQALWQIGGAPVQHRTDHLGAAVHPLSDLERTEFRARYRALLAHYGMEPSTNNLGLAHENGAVEQGHHRFKQAVDQALRVRGSRDFAERAAYERFLRDLVQRRNQTRAVRFAVEQAALRPLPRTPLAPCRELRATVSRFSTLQVLGNTYSVPSRLIGTTLTVRVQAETVAVYVGPTLTCTMPRLHGRQQHAINYQHVIWSLVRKPGAFAAYRYRDDLFPSLAFRWAYDQLCTHSPARADREYVQVLHLAASTAESEVETALQLLREAEVVPSFAQVRALVRRPQELVVPALRTPVLDLSAYDALLPSRCAHGC